MTLPLRRSLGLASILFASTTGGCGVILGLGDFTEGQSGAGGATAGTSVSGTGGAAPTGSSGTGGQPDAGTFSFAIKEATVTVPQGTYDFIDVAITRGGGFTAAVDVALDASSPTGLLTMPLTIAAGSTTGKLQLSASNALALGTSFTLKLVATSGVLTKSASAPAVVTGAPGTLDLGWGSAGIVQGPDGTGAPILLNDIRQVALDKILVAGSSYGKLGSGNIVGLRYLPDGTPDTTFNTTGDVAGTICACSNAKGAGVTVGRDSGGNVFTIGYGNPIKGVPGDIMFYRYKDSGVLDAIDSADHGYDTIDLGGDEVVNAALFVQTSGKILATGSSSGKLFAARVNGSYSALDTSFATTGWLAPAVGGTTSMGEAVALDAMGRVLVAGSINSGTETDLVLLRLNGAGVLDSSFGTGGLVTLARTGDQHAGSVLVQPDGNIVLVGVTSEAGGQFLVQRFLPSGAPDPAFGTGGAALAPLGLDGSSTVDPLVRAVLLGNGRIVVADNGTFMGATGPVFARLLADGTLDATYGMAGEQTLNVGMETGVHAITVASDGTLLIAGSHGSYPFHSYLARLWN